MNVQELIEFTLMLLVENKCLKDSSFSKYVERTTSVSTFNKRYNELLDKFLNQYALNKTEKSE